MPASPVSTAKTSPRKLGALLSTSKASAATRAISKRSAIESPFLRLPAEIRNCIYEYALGGRLLHITAPQERVAAEGRHIHGDEFSDASDSEDGSGWDLDYSESDSEMASRETTKFSYCVCRAKISEQEAFRRSQDASLDERIKPDLGQEVPWEMRTINYFRLGDRHYIDSCVVRHSCCMAFPPSSYSWPGDQKYSKKVPRPSSHHKLAIALLRVCRQIYNEARLIPYSTNTFSFTLASTFSTFLTSLIPAQRRATTSLHLLVRSDRFFRIDDTSYLEHATQGEGATAWTRALTVRKITTLPNLKTLHLSLCAEPFNALGTVKEGMTEPEAYLPFRRAVSNFQRLPLEAVTVILSDDPNTFLGEVIFREALRQATPHNEWEFLRERICLTAEKKREWAVRTRRKLLQSWDQSQSPEAVKARRQEEWARKRKRQETNRSTEVRKRYCLRGGTETEG